METILIDNEIKRVVDIQERTGKNPASGLSLEELLALKDLVLGVDNNKKQFDAAVLRAKKQLKNGMLASEFYDILYKELKND